jgi:hypothetical protein
MRCGVASQAAMPNAQMREMYDRWRQTQPCAALLTMDCCCEECRIDVM